MTTSSTRYRNGDAHHAVAWSLAIVFFGLWLLAISLSPRITQTPPLTTEDIQAMEVGRKLKGVSPLQPDDTFAGIKSVRLTVAVDESCKKAIQDERIRSRIELAIRRCGVRIDNASPGPELVFSFDGMWEESMGILSHAHHVTLTELVFVSRNSTPKAATGNVWSRGGYGMTGRTHAEKQLLKAADDLCEQVENQILASSNQIDRKSN